MNKNRNAKTMTDAQFNSFIISYLRKASAVWKPKLNCIKNARVARGLYLCALCGKIVPASIQGVFKTGERKGKPKRIKNITADHINPVVDPKKGFVDWNTYIDRLFLEDGWQASCYNCHINKSKEENKRR